MFEKGKINNGQPKFDAFTEKLVSVVPSPRQLKYLEMEYYNFIHFGMNTFTGREWGDGSEKEDLFQPSSLDTDQWCEAMKNSGSKGVILTAKHHDGYCLWQTKYTEHSVKNSPWRGGKGDVLADLSKSCAKYGLKLGVYLSPWDRNHPLYGDNRYNDYFVNQLTELLTGYGELFSVWFDGARGEGVQMKPDFRYDYERFYSLIRKYQPDANIAICGPDVRWVGNEGGHSRASEWSVVSDGEQDPSKVAALSQTNPEMAAQMQKINHMSPDIGSREVLSCYDSYRFYPAEVDVSIHPGWFYHDNEDPRTLENLLHIYFTGVGGNSSLLLNIPPDQRGLFAERDVARLREFGDGVRSVYARPVGYDASFCDDETLFGRTIVGLRSGENGSFAMAEKEYLIRLDLEGEQEIRTVELREDLTKGQRIEYFDVYARTEAGYEKIAEATNVGNRRTVRLDKPVKTDRIVIEIVQSRCNPVLRSIGLFA